MKMFNWDDRERSLDEIYVEDGENEPESFLNERLFIKSSYYHLQDGYVTKQVVEEDIPEGEKFLELYMETDDFSGLTSCFVFYFDENHELCSGAYPIDEKRNIEKRNEFIDYVIDKYLNEGVKFLGRRENVEAEVPIYW